MVSSSRILQDRRSSQDEVAETIEEVSEASAPQVSSKHQELVDRHHERDHDSIEDDFPERAAFLSAQHKNHQRLQLIGPNCALAVQSSTVLMEDEEDVIDDGSMDGEISIGSNYLRDSPVLFIPQSDQQTQQSSKLHHQHSSLLVDEAHVEVVCSSDTALCVPESPIHSDD